MSDVVFPWGRSCSDAIIQPPVKQLQCEHRVLTHENQFTGQHSTEATAFQRWHYAISWDYLNNAEATLLELWLNKLKSGRVAEIPVYTAYLQPNIAFFVSATAGAEQCTVTSSAGLEEGHYFRVGSSLHQVVDIESSNTINIKPLLRTTHNLTPASTYRPRGRFFMPDKNTAVRRSGASATLDLTLMEHF